MNVGDLNALGILLPEGMLHSEAFGLLAAFVAINTVMYVALAVAKMCPKVYLSDVLSHGNRRTETRSIHPDAPGDDLGSNGSPEGARR